jgi:hypothetical protein
MRELDQFNFMSKPLRTRSTIMNQQYQSVNNSKYWKELKNFFLIEALKKILQKIEI